LSIRLPTGARPNCDIDQIIGHLQELLPSTPRRYFVIIDGLDECEEREVRLLLEHLNQLVTSRHYFQIFCSRRPDVLRWAPTLINTQLDLSISAAGSENDSEIAQYIERELGERIESGSFRPGDYMIISAIVNALLQGAQGMLVFSIRKAFKDVDSLQVSLGDFPT
jgi:hypothetical protein